MSAVLETANSPFACHERLYDKFSNGLLWLARVV